VATEAAAIVCPVCGEAFAQPAFAQPPARCFRCETDLTQWWPLDQAIRALGPLAATPAPPSSPPAVGARRRTGRRGWKNWGVPALLVAGLLGALWLTLESTRRPEDRLPARGVPGPTTAAQAPVRSPVPPTPVAVAATPTRTRRTLRYVVQPGDSLWRIAAALKGDGARWPDLVPRGERMDPSRLRPGQELSLVIDEDAR
jgi:nucleoid-associated protein YgaU